MLYVNDFNHLRPHVPRANAGGSAVSHDPDDLGNVYVRSQTSHEMIPLKALMTVTDIIGPEQLERFNGYLAAKVVGIGKPGRKLRRRRSKRSNALPARRCPMATTSPGPDRHSRNNAPAVRPSSRSPLPSSWCSSFSQRLYGRWRLPFSVVLAVPFAIAGALTFVALRGKENDIYFQIGLVVLIGLAAKNAILIVEFAQQGCLQAMSATDAALEAARLRFRPIVMTSLAFMLGVAAARALDRGRAPRRVNRWARASSAACSSRPSSRRSSYRYSS